MCGFDRGGKNEVSLDKLVFILPFVFSLINQKPSDENNLNNDTKSRTLSQNRGPILRSLTLKTYGFALLTGVRDDLRKSLYSN